MSQIRQPTIFRGFRGVQRWQPFCCQQRHLPWWGGASVTAWRVRPKGGNKRKERKIGECTCVSTHGASDPNRNLAHARPCGGQVSRITVPSWGCKASHTCHFSAGCPTRPTRRRPMSSRTWRVRLLRKQWQRARCDVRLLRGSGTWPRVCCHLQFDRRIARPIAPREAIIQGKP
jgi:hypothetical protein